MDQSTFFVQESSQPALYPNFYGPPQPNTIVTTDLDVPRTAWIQPRVSASPGPGEYLTSFFTFPDRFRLLSQHRNWLAAGAEAPLAIPGGLPLEMSTTKIRNGVQTRTVDTLRVPGGQTLTVDIHF